MISKKSSLRGIVRKKFCYISLAIGIVWILGGEVMAQQGNHLHSLSFLPQNRTLLLGTHRGLFESLDEGKSWKARTLKGDVPGVDFMTMVTDPTNPKVVYAGGHDLTVIKSEDSGMTWRSAGKGLPTMDIHALAIDPLRPKRLHAWAVGKGLYRSDDGARSWFRVDDGPENPHVMSLTSVPIPTGMGGIFLYAGTAVGLFRNADCF